MSFPRLATSIHPFPRLVLSYEQFPGHVFGDHKEEYVVIPQYATNSPTPNENPPTPIRRSKPVNISSNYATLSPTVSPASPPNTPKNYTPPNTTDYDYEETSNYELFRDMLDETKHKWPLSTKDEDTIISEHKEKYPDQDDFDTILIKMAFLKSNDRQKELMISLADKLHYTL